MRTPLPPAHAAVTLADCVLPPSLHLSARIARMLGVEGDLLEPHQPLLEYYARMQDHPVVGPVLDELTAAQTIYDAKAARKSH
jgi:glutathione S-transferase